MSPRCLVPLLAILFSLPALPGAAEPSKPRTQEAPPGGAKEAAPKTPPVDADALARRLWAITGVILEHHVKPPSRQEMLSAGTTALLATAKGASPNQPGSLGAKIGAVNRLRPPAVEVLSDDLRHRISQLTSTEQLAVFLKEVWPKAGAAKNASAEGLETSLWQGLFQSVPGGARQIPQRELKVMEQFNANRYVGTGIQISQNGKENLTQIMTAFPGGPARRAGAKESELILEVDGVSMQGAGIQKVVERLRGEEGTAVTMVVRQPGSQEKRTLAMIRSVIPFVTAEGYRRVSEEAWEYRIDPAVPVAYVRLNAVRSSTLHELRKIERRLQADGCRALVLDLRYSQADLHHATILADGLLDGGVLWRLRDKHNKVTEVRADRDCLFRDWPLAVLVGNSIGRGIGVQALATALQDNHRAILVGELLTSVGYVTTPVPLPDGQGALFLATAILERAASGPPATVVAIPGKKVPPVWSLQPDHQVRMSNEQRKALQQRLFGERKTDAKAGNEKTPDDPQLAKAVELLRATLDTTAQRKDSR